MSCINIGHPDFKKLQKELKDVPQDILEVKVGLWMDNSGEDRFPTVDELNIRYDEEFIEYATSKRSNVKVLKEELGTEAPILIENTKENFERIENVSNLILNKLSFKNKPYFIYGKNEEKEKVTIFNKEFSTSRISKSYKNITGEELYLHRIKSKAELEKRIDEELKKDLVSIWQTKIYDAQEWETTSYIKNSPSETKRLLLHFLKKGINSLSEFSPKQQEVIKNELPKLFSENKFKTEKQAIHFYQEHVIKKFSRLTANEKNNNSLFEFKRKAFIKKYQTLIDLATILPNYKKRIKDILLEEYNRLIKFEQQEKYDLGKNLTTAFHNAGFFYQGYKSSEGPKINVDDYFDDKFIEEEHKFGETDTLKILSRIIATKDNYSELAKSLLEFARVNNIKIKLVSKEKESAAGRYIANIKRRYHVDKDGIIIGSAIKEDYIYINKDSNEYKTDPHRLLLHEIIHSFSSIYVAAKNYEQGKDNSIKQYMDYIKEYIRQNTKVFGMFTDMPYGFTNETEFVSEVLSNNEFIELLKLIPPMEKSKFENLFSELLNFIIKLFGIKQHTNAYEQFHDVIYGIMKQQKEFDLYGEHSLKNLKNISNAQETKTKPEEKIPLTTIKSIREDAIKKFEILADQYSKRFPDNPINPYSKKIYSLKSKDDLTVIIALAEYAKLEIERIIGSDTVVGYLDKLIHTYRTAENKNKISREDKLTLGKLNGLFYKVEALGFISDMLNKAAEILEKDKKANPLTRAVIQKYTAPISRAKDVLNGVMITIGKDLAADWLVKYTDNPEMTREKILDMLTFAHSDITFTQMWMDSAAESPDTILALMDKAIKWQRAFLNRDVTEYSNTVILPLEEKLIEFQKAKNIDRANNEKFFDFMLEKDEKGELTGNYIEPERLLQNLKTAKVTSSETDPRYLYLKEFDTRYQKFQDLLPAGYKMKRQLPIILKHGIERAKEYQMKNMGKAAKETLKDKLYIREDESEFVEITKDRNDRVRRFIPIKFTGKLRPKEDGKTGVDPKDISYDVTDSLLTFIKMSGNYSKMKSILDQLELTARLLGERKVAVKKGKKYQVAKGTKDIVAGGKSGKDSNTYERAMALLDMSLYGEYKIDQGTMGNTSISWSKAGDTVAEYTALTQLVFNVYSGLNNVIVGQFNNLIEGFGGQFYSPSDYLAAQKEFGVRIPDLMKDAYSRRKESKLGLFFQTYDIHQEFDELGRVLPSASRLARYTSEAHFIMQNAGEFANQSMLAIAMMKSHRVVGKTIQTYPEWVIANDKKFNKESKKEFEKFSSVYDAMEIVDGKLKIKGLETKPIAVVKFTERMKGVYQNLHGNYSKGDKTMMNRLWQTRLFLLFRRWLKPAWNRRYAKEKFNEMDVFDERIGMNMAGMYTVTWNFIWSLAKGFKDHGMKLSLIQENWKELPKYKQQLIKKTAAEITVMVATAIAVTLLSGLKDDDDDDDWLLSMAEFQARRVYGEFRMYTSYQQAINILRSPYASITLAEKWYKAFEQLYLWERYEVRPHKGELKLTEYSKDIIPFWGQIDAWTEPENRLKSMR